MPRDFLKDAKPEYDVVVIGSGLAGLTAANVLARAARSTAQWRHHFFFLNVATKRQTIPTEIEASMSLKLVDLEFHPET